MDSRSLAARVVAGCVWFVVPLATASPQARVWSVQGDARRDALGAAVIYVPDVDGDGVPDFLAGAPGGDGYPVAGRASLRSGATGAVLHEWIGQAGDQFGIGVAQLGDVDGDGIADVAIGSRGTTYVYSGASGALLYSVTHLDSSVAIAALGDIDGDGIADLIVVSGTNEADLFSGATGAPIRQHTSASVAERWISVGDAGDVDRDGVSDYIVGATQKPNGSAYVYSGATGALIWTLTAVNGGETYGEIVKGVGDIDGDGTADLLVASPDWLLPPSYYYSDGHLWIHSGATGQVIRSRAGNVATGESFGSAVSKAGDVDGDGVTDYAVGLGNPGIENVRLFSGASGAILKKFQIDRVGITALDATADPSGDGLNDLLAGFPKDSATLQDVSAGQCVCVDGASHLELFRVAGLSFVSQCGSALAVLADRDGDGHHEVAVGSPGGLGDARGVVQILSGRDGHELARLVAPSIVTSFGASLTPLDDVNSDGVRDYAIGNPGMASATIQSGVDDSLLATFQASVGYGGGAFGTALAAGTDASGAVELAIGAPQPIYIGNRNGEVDLYDATSGALLLTVAGTTSGAEFGTSVACAGDVDADGSIDWVAGAPKDGFGSITLFSGATGAILWKQYASPTDVDFGYSLTTPGDLNGDGVGDVLAGSPVDYAMGHVLAYSGVDGSPLLRLDGPSAYAYFGEGAGTVGDVNRDGVSDFAISAVAEFNRPGDGTVFLYSGATASLLERFDDDDAPLQLGGRFATTDLGTETRVDPDPIPDLLIGSPMPLGLAAGSAELRRLDDLFLQIDPDVATAGQSVTIATRGGPGGAPAGLRVLALDGAPLNLWAAFGTLGVDGIWTLAGTVPPGLAGHALTFRSYAIGFTGRIVDSSDAILTFQ